MNGLDGQQLFGYFRAMEYVHRILRVKWNDSNINYCQGRKEVNGEIKFFAFEDIRCREPREETKRISHLHVYLLFIRTIPLSALCFVFRTEAQGKATDKTQTFFFF